LGFAQTINGNLSLLVKQSIKLEDFNGLKTSPISSTTIDDKGNFTLSFVSFPQDTFYDFFHKRIRTMEDDFLTD